MIGHVGRDGFGETLLANPAAGVDVTAVAVDESAGSGMSVAILQDDGDYGAVIVSGSNMGMAASGLAAALEPWRVPRFFVLQNEIPTRQMSPWPRRRGPPGPSLYGMRHRPVMRATTFLVMSMS